jgi:hypothetical protein
MTQLPPRSDISDVSSTQGTIRQALGDMRDFLHESFGGIGGEPTLSNGNLKGLNNLAVRASTLNSDARVVGSMVIDNANSTLSNPGDGSLALAGSFSFRSYLGQKFNLEGSSYALGIQDSTLYVRTAQNFTVYKQGEHSDTEGDAGSGGQRLLQVNGSGISHRGNTIWHEGNDGQGSGLNADLVRGQDVYTTLNDHVNNSELHRDWYDWQLDGRDFIRDGHITLTQYLPSDSDSNIYRTVLNYGDEGDTQIKGNSLIFHDKTVWHSGNDGANSGLDSDLVDGLQASSFLRKDQHTSTNYNISASTIKADNHLRANGSFYISDQDSNRVRIASSSGTLICDQPDSSDPLEYLKVQNNHVFHQGFMGDGTGLDADHLDGADRDIFVERVSSTKPGVHHLYTTSNDDPGSFFYSYKYYSRWELWVRGTDDSKDDVYVAKAGDIPDGIPKNRLHKGEASHTDYIDNGTSGQFAIQKDSFFPYVNKGPYKPQIVGAGESENNWENEWIIYFETSNGNFSGGLKWRYLTNSGNPKVWALITEKGEINTLWEAEDPANDEFPDDPPIKEREGLTRVQLKMPSHRQIKRLIQQSQNSERPEWQHRSIYKDCRDNHELLCEMVRQLLQERSLDDFDNLEDLISTQQVPEQEKRDWRKQLITRSASRILFNTPNHDFGSLLQTYFKVGQKGNLSLK